jgi:hypothetical protein
MCSFLPPPPVPPLLDPRKSNRYTVALVVARQESINESAASLINNKWKEEKLSQPAAVAGKWRPAGEGESGSEGGTAGGVREEPRSPEASTCRNLVS